ncbi:hypothetical protein JTB14_035964 [Gonioctena quinquepunctata]|nr:hypothetical protein JTB14_035964 [Gonioctena quinquepunctata]
MNLGRFPLEPHRCSLSNIRFFKINKYSYQMFSIPETSLYGVLQLDKFIGGECLFLKPSVPNEKFAIQGTITNGYLPFSQGFY